MIVTADDPPLRNGGFSISNSPGHLGGFSDADPTPHVALGCASWFCHPRALFHDRYRLTAEVTVASAEQHASTILRAYEDAQAELLDKAVVLTDGKAGTIEKVWLDELHGLRISIRGHEGQWPVSTIKFAQEEPATTSWRPSHPIS
jgi:hypothetical protein